MVFVFLHNHFFKMRANLVLVCLMMGVSTISAVCVYNCPSGALSWVGYSNNNCAPAEAHLGASHIRSIPVPSGPIVLEGSCDPTYSCQENLFRYGDYAHNFTTAFYATCYWVGGNTEEATFVMSTFSDPACTAPYNAWGTDSTFKYSNWDTCDPATPTVVLPELTSLYRSDANNNNTPFHLFTLAMISATILLVI